MVFFQYSNPVENVGIYSAIFSFFLFLLFILIFKVASGKESYSKLNRIHLKIFFIYTLGFLMYVLLKKEFSVDSVISYLVGSFIYFSLHYVFLFSLIGIAKKSISINVLDSIKTLENQGKIISEESLSLYMSEKKIGIGDIRENRLNQMTHLKFAIAHGSQYTITSFGKKIHKIGAIILKIWNQKRL